MPSNVPHAVLLVKENCDACTYIKEHTQDLPNFSERVEIVDGKSPDGMVILADHEMLEGAPMPFLEVDGEYFSDGYKNAKDKDGKPMIAAIRSKIVKKITEICEA